jgi:hypothetical protein
MGAVRLGVDVADAPDDGAGAINAANDRRPDDLGRGRISRCQEFLERSAAACEEFRELEAQRMGSECGEAGRGVRRSYHGAPELKKRVAVERPQECLVL